MNRPKKTISAALLTASVIAFASSVIGVWASFASWLSTSDLSSSGTTLSSASWNRLVNAVIELDARTSKTNYVEGTIGTNAPITLPHSTQTYTKNSITLPVGKWEVTMVAGVVGNSFWSWWAWNAYHVHHNLSSTQPSYTPFQEHSYWSEGSPYANSPVIQIVDVSSTTTLYWFSFWNGWSTGPGSGDTATFWYSYPNVNEKPYFYAKRLQ